jgi:glutamyl-tRNA synthetase
MDGRFAPSPTGPLHLGSLRTALVAWLFARSAGSRIVLRIEDLDPVASRAEHERSQRRDLARLGLDFDGEVVRQSERLERYRDVIDGLVRDGLTYPCYCTRREVLEAATAPHEHLPDGAYPGTCRDLGAAARAEREAAGRRPALRLRAGGVEVGFLDRLHGPQAGVVDDFVIRRADGTPAYNLAVVVGDHHPGVQQGVRGDDLLAGTPRQVHLARLLGLGVPAYAHVPLVLGPDGVRLAKRHGAVTLDDRVARGETPAGVLAELATSLDLAEPGEPVTLDALVARFDPDRVPRHPWRLPPTAPGG